jgi:protein TonB
MKRSARASPLLAALLVSLAIHASVLAGLWGGLGRESAKGVSGSSETGTKLVGFSVVGERPRVAPVPSTATATTAPSREASSPGLTAADAATDQDAVTVASMQPMQPTGPTSPGAASASANNAVAAANGASAIGNGGGDGNAAGDLAAYVARIRARIGESLRYPLALRRRGVQGRVGLKLTLDEEGALQAREISERSGSDELDALALEAAASAQPFPKPVDALAKKGPLVLNLPVEFKLR